MIVPLKRPNSDHAHRPDHASRDRGRTMPPAIELDLSVPHKVRLVCVII